MSRDGLTSSKCQFCLFFDRPEFDLEVEHPGVCHASTVPHGASSSQAPCGGGDSAGFGRSADIPHSVAQVHAFGQVSPNETDGLFHRSLLPGTVRIAEVREQLQPFLDQRVLSSVRSPIKGQGPAEADESMRNMNVSSYLKTR
jgi:hypothetical protein